MGRKANTIYQDLEKLVWEVYDRLRERRDYDKIEDYPIETILEETKYFKSEFNEGGNVYELFLEDREDVMDYELNEWNELHREYKDLCKFMDKWFNKKEDSKQAKNNKIADKKEILNSLEKGTKINIDKYGIVEFIKCNRTRFLAIYKNEEWTFPVNNFIEIVEQ